MDAQPCGSCSLGGCAVTLGSEWPEAASCADPRSRAPPAEGDSGQRVRMRAVLPGPGSRVEWGGMSGSGLSGQLGSAVGAGKLLGV